MYRGIFRYTFILYFIILSKKKSLNIDQFQRLIILSFSFYSFEEIQYAQFPKFSRFHFSFRYFSSNIELNRRIFFFLDKRYSLLLKI